MFETPDGIIDIGGYTQQQRVEFFQKYPDARQLGEDEIEAQQIAIGLMADKTGELTDEQSEELSSFVKQTAERYDFEPKSVYREEQDQEKILEDLKKFNKFNTYKESLESERPVSFESVEEYGEFNDFLKGKDPSAPPIDQQIEEAAERYDSDLDISKSNTYYNEKKDNSFIRSQYDINEIKELFKKNEVEFNEDDLQGYLNKIGFVEDFEKLDESFVKKFNSLAGKFARYTRGSLVYMDEQSKLDVAKEQRKKYALDTYIEGLRSKKLFKEFYSDYNKDPKAYSSFENTSDAFNSWLESSKGLKSISEYSVIDDLDLQKFQQKEFPNLVTHEKKVAEKLFKHTRDLEDETTTDYILDGLSGLFDTRGFSGSFIRNAQSLRDLAAMTLGMDDYVFEKMAIRSVNQQLDAGQNMSYSYVEGSSATLPDGVKYLRDHDGNVYNTKTEAVVLDPKKLEEANAAIDKEGVKDSSWSFRGGLPMIGNVLGELAFQMLGTKGLTGARRVASAKYLKTMNAARKAKGLKPISTQARDLSSGLFRKGNTKGTFGSNRITEKTARVLDNTFFSGGYGYSQGYESILTAAKEANLSDEEAEKLAVDGAGRMGLLYLATGPAASRIPAIDKLDDWLKSSGVASKSINEYKRSQSTSVFNKFLDEQIKKIVPKQLRPLVRRGGVFIKEGGKETIQEDIQQQGEVYYVNSAINRMAGFDFLQSDYGDAERKLTAAISFATGGTVASVSLPKFKQNKYSRLQNLYVMGSDPKKSKQFLDFNVKIGKINTEQANEILSQAEAIYKHSKNKPGWMYNDPQLLIDFAVGNEKIEKLKKQKEKAGEGFESYYDEEIKKQKQQTFEAVDKAIKAKIKKDVETVASETAKIEGVRGETIVLETDEDFEKYNVDPAQSDNAFFTAEDGNIYINLNRAAQDADISAPSHELLHKIVSSQFKSKDGKLDPKMNKVMNEFKQVLKDKGLFDIVDSRLKGYRSEKARIEKIAKEEGWTDAELRKQTSGLDVDGVDSDEWLTQFFKLTAEGNINFSDLDENSWLGLGRKILNFVKSKLNISPKQIDRLDFTSGKQVFDFIVDYQKGISEGRLTEKAKAGLRQFEEAKTKGIKEKGDEASKKKSLSLLEDINNLVPKDAKTKEQFLDRKVFNAVFQSTQPGTEPKSNIKLTNVGSFLAKKDPSILETIGNARPNEQILKVVKSLIKDESSAVLTPQEIDRAIDLVDKDIAEIKNGAIYNYIMSREASIEEKNIMLDRVRERLINYDPAAVRKTKSGQPITFGEFLFANTAFSQRDAKKKLAIDSERQAESLDTEEARQVADEPITETTEDPRVEYQNLVEANVLPADMVAKMQEKILLVTKTLKSRIDAAVSKNKTVTPLMSEIKEEMGKQADILFKSALGVKRGDELKNNFLKLKKPILENMTTTWLMGKDKSGKVLGGMPFAIEKSVNGKFTPDWQGKKIDRETVNTSKAGRTDGKPIVRRLPNAANKIKDSQFLTYMFDSNGDVVRGAKESLSKALAQEYALDVYREQLLDPESEIRKAFVDNQEMLGVEIAENTIQEFFRQAERGNVKRSIPTDELTGQVKVIVARIKKKGSDIENVIDVENGEIIDEELKKKELSQEAINIVVHGFDNLLIDFEKQRRYVEGILSNPNIPKYAKEGFKTISKDSPIEIRKAFAESVTDFAADLDPEVIELLGFDFLGFINRILDPAAKKIDEVATQKAKDKYFAENGKEGKGLTKYLIGEDGEYITGDFYPQFLNISNLPGKPGDLPSDIDMSKVRPMNTSISNGLFDRINRILNNKKGKNYDYSKLDAEGKKAELAKLVPEIEEANKHNKKLFKYLIKKLVNSNMPDIHFLQLLQLQTQAVKGFRALTALVYWTITDGPMGLPKGEHLADNAGTMEEIAELRYLGLKGKYLDAKIDEILEYHDQWISARKTLDLVDAAGGVTNKNKDKRINLLPKSDRDQVFTIYGEPSADLIAKRSDNIDKVNKIREGVLNNQKNADNEKAVNNATKRSYSENPKGISVYDFDDTLAFSKSQIIVKKDGKTFKINAAQFAKQGETLLAEGAEFDFSEFNKVVKGKAGPLIPRIQKAIDKFGNNNIFILTARPVASESAIHAFMKGLGIDIPRANITGLANSTAQAKADWMVGKVAEGFNDFYFVDDAIKNVRAVKDVLEAFDVKSKVQQAIAQRKRSMSSDLNEMIERNTGVRAETTYSKVLARKKGAQEGKFKFFVPYSAEDFKGLTSYTLAGKGKQGEADQRFFDKNLILPYTRGIAAMEGATQALKNDYKNLLGMFGLKKQLPKKIGDTDFTTDQAVRVYLWDQQGFDIPNISKRDQNKLSRLVAKDPDLVGFAEGLMAVSKKDNWIDPKEHWDVGSILKDLNDITDNVNRKEYLAEFIENVDEMFDKTTLNKLEAIYGTNYVEALQDSIRRMKSGSNAPRSAGKIEQKWLNWVNNSVGTIMFFNRRSALLQMLSFTNFINWSDNNPARAAAAFANQPLYWKKWVEIFNSDKLKERRGGLKSDIQESEIANQAKNSKDKASAVISYLLKIGFTPTQIADSFAIATGGATFLINRTKKYEKQGFSKKEAEAKAFEDFGRISDETQQSGDPMLISQQQASHLGRLILAFQNTPMQYTRLMKKAGKDIINRRGSDVENLSKIAYYGFVQNLIFSSLQSALFALIPGFDDEEEDDAKLEDKAIRTANSMVDTILRGSGLAGAVISTLKNAIMRYQKEDKKGYTADHTYTMLELANISPPIGSKLRKVYSAIQTKKFNQAAIDEMGYGLTIDGKFNPSPNYEIIANVSSAAANIPLDRLLSEVKSINEAFDSRNTSYQRIALALGWRTWDVNVKNEEQDLIKVKAKAAKKEAGKQKAKETKKLKKKIKLDRIRSMTDEEMKALRAASLKRKEEARQRILAEREKSSK